MVGWGRMLAPLPWLSPVHTYTTSNTTHPGPLQPCPKDAAGFERHEAADNALFLIERGVPPEAILEESASLETVRQPAIVGPLLKRLRPAACARPFLYWSDPAASWVLA